MEIPANPDVTLHFYGLEVFFFDKEKGYCKVGIHNDAPNHDIRVGISRRNRGTNSVVSTAALTLQHEQVNQAGEIWLEVTNPPLAKINAGDPYKADGGFMRPIGNNDKNDSRWLLDLEEIYAGQPLTFAKDMLSPCLVVKNALFFTERRTPDSYKLVPTAAGQPEIILGQIAQWTAANIYLGSRSQLVLKLGQNGAPLFTLMSDPEYAYDVTIDNSETSVQPTQMTPMGSMLAGNAPPAASPADGVRFTKESSPHFQEYYSLLKTIPGNGLRYDLQVIPGAGSLTPPCNGVGGGRMSSLE